MAESAIERLARLLAMVPWLLRHPGVSLAAAAMQFSVSPRQLVRDLELLFVCGLPGHLPDDLIEADWESGYIFIGNAQSIANPLRLGVDEATALLVALQALAEVPGLGDRAAVGTALAKLQSAAGSAVPIASGLRVDVQPGHEPTVLRDCQRALAERLRLRLEYFVPHRDHRATREVDPMRLLHSGGQWYLEAWCHRARSVRLFRTDRMESVHVLSESGVPPEQAKQRELSESLFTPDPNAQLVRLRITAAVRWVVDYYPSESVLDLADGGAELSLRISDPRWLRALVLRLGGECAVLSPPELIDQVRQHAQLALAQYLTDGNSVTHRLAE